MLGGRYIKLDGFFEIMCNILQPILSKLKTIMCGERERERKIEIISAYNSAYIELKYHCVILARRQGTKMGWIY
jgi:hypothetical protein